MKNKTSFWNTFSNWLNKPKRYKRGSVNGRPVDILENDNRGTFEVVVGIDSHGVFKTIQEAEEKITELKEKVG